MIGLYGVHWDASLLCAPLPLDGKATHRARQCADPSIPAQAQFVCGLDGEGGQRDLVESQ